MSFDKVNYAALAGFLSSHPEVFAIKRFRELQIRNLLFYQAELAHLEAELLEIENQDAQEKYDSSDRTNFRWTPRMAEDIAISTKTPNNTGTCEKPGPSPSNLTETTSSSYRKKILQIRRTLVSYNDAVEQYKRLASLPSPKRRDMVAIHEWLNDMNLGTAFLAGDVEDVWTVELGDGKSKPAETSDFYSFEDQSNFAFRIGSVVAWLQQLYVRSSINEPRQVHHIDTSSSSTLDQAITTVAASILPVLPIVVFYFVKNLLVRIGLILAFTAIFSAILVVGFQIKPHATLAITTAIAAIQVVYVGSTASDGK